MKLNSWLSVLRKLFSEKNEIKCWWQALRGVSFSQFSEDLFYARTYRLPPKGFYVDVGAAYPIFNSNTYRLYLKGWRGITIEPNPNLRKSHNRVHPRDCYVCAGVAEQAGELDYYSFQVRGLQYL